MDQIHSIMNYSNPQPNDILIIDQGTDFKRDTSNYYIYITIAFVYAFFLALLIDRLLNYDHVEKKCNISDLQGEDYLYNNKLCIKAQKEYDSKKFVYMVILGVASIFGGVFLARYDDGYVTGGMGIGLGGVALVLYYTVANWSLLNRNLQVIVLGLTFAILFCGSMMLYK